MATDNAILTVEFCGERQSLASEDTLTFGRCGDLVIDDNPYLHRVVGRFVHRQGHWWLQNQGTKITVGLRDLRSATRLSVAPGEQVALLASEFTINFIAGPTSYELSGTRVCLAAEDPMEAFDAIGTATIDFGVVPLSSEQHLLLVALCEMRLMDSDSIPTNQSLASRLGWTITKFNRKLDHLCAKLSREGVRGLRGGPDGLALDRRHALIDHALSVRLVTIDDLGLLARQAS